MNRVRCRCNFMELWDPAVTYRRGVIDHSAAKCEATCEGCKSRESDLAALRAAVEALLEATRFAVEPARSIPMVDLIESRNAVRSLLPGGDAKEEKP